MPIDRSLIIGSDDEKEREKRLARSRVAAKMTKFGRKVTGMKDERTKYEKPSEAGPEPPPDRPLLKGVDKSLIAAAKTMEQREAQEYEKYLPSARRQLAKQNPVMAAGRSLLTETGLDMLSMWDRPTDDKAADIDVHIAQAFGQARRERYPDGWMGNVLEAGHGAGRSLIPMAAVGMATRSPNAVIAYAAVSEGNQAITTGRDAGLRGKQLAAYATGKGVIEGGIAATFGKVGLGGAEKILGGRMAAQVGTAVGLKKLGVQLAAEEVEEIATEVAHTLYDVYTDVDKEDLSTEKIMGVAAQTALQTAMTMGFIGGPGVYYSGREAKRRGEIMEYAKENKVPSRKKWKEWGYDPKEGSSRTNRKVATQLAGGIYQAEADAAVKGVAENEIKKGEARAQARAGAQAAVAQAQAESMQQGPSPANQAQLAEPQLQAAPQTGIESQMAAGPQQAAEGVSERDQDITPPWGRRPDAPPVEPQQAPMPAPRPEPEQAKADVGKFIKEEKGTMSVPVKQRPQNADIIGQPTKDGKQDPKVDIVPPDPQVARRTKRSHGRKKEPLLDRIGKQFKEGWHHVTRTNIHLSQSDPKFAAARETLRLLKAVPQMSIDEAIRTVAAVVDPMGPKQAELFETSLILANQIRALERNEGFRHGWKDKQSLQDFKTKIDGYVNETPIVKKAIEHRQQVVDDTVLKLVDRGLVPEAMAQDTQGYFHQQVNLIQEAKSKTARRGADLRRGKKSFMKGRVKDRQLSEEYDPNTSYVESETEWLADAFSEIRKDDLMQQLMSIYDVRDDVQALAEADGVTLEEYVRGLDNMSIWFPQPGNTFYKAFSIPEKVGEALQQGIIEEANLTKEQVNMVLAMGGPHKAVVIPTDLAAQLESAQEKAQAHWVTALNERAMNSWKAWTLLNPKRVLAYNIRNFTGDLDAAFAGDPLIMREIPEAVKELWAYHHGSLKLSDDVRESRDNGVIGAGFFGAEVAETKELQIFRRLSPQEKTKVMKNPVKFYMNFIRPNVELRENILRLAAYKHYKKAIKKDGLKHYGAARRSHVNMIELQMGPEVAAAHMSRELIGDYGGLTSFGEVMRRKMIPFWAFQEVNLKRYPRLMINAFQAGQGRTRASAVVATASMMRIGTAYGALWAWNNLAAPVLFGHDDEDELGDYDRANPHILLGHNADGSVRVFRNVGALGDFLEWFGVNEALSSLDEIKSGQKTVGEAAWSAGTAWADKLAGGMRPDIKAGIEAGAGVSLFPNPFSPRSQRRDEAISNIFGLTDEMKMAKGLAVGRGNRARLNYFQRLFVGVVDPRSTALGEMYDARRNFLKSKGVAEGGIYPVSEYKNARQAYQQGDFKAFVEWRSDFQRKYGPKSFKKFKAFLSRLDPIGSRLSDADEYEFVHRYITPEQRQNFYEVQAYAREMKITLGMWWRADGQKRPAGWQDSKPDVTYKITREGVSRQ